MSELVTEGFDLDALAGENPGEVIFEIGGGATVVPNEQEASTSSPSVVPETPTSQLDQAEKWKQQGNEEFRKGNYLEAYDMYTNAIEECPCPVKAEDIVRQRDEFDEMEREKARSRMEEETRQRSRENNNSRGKEENTNAEESKKSEKAQQQQQQQDPATFELEPQENGEKLAIFLNNRAASLVQLQRFEEAIKDADIAILLNPKYTKAYIRRSSAYEKTERTEEALRDARQALELEPSNATFRKSVARLQKIEDQRLEKLKVRRANRCCYGPVTTTYCSKIRVLMSFSWILS
jgi:tetratricopeptide (TPR) repeat protein